MSRAVSLVKAAWILAALAAFAFHLYASWFTTAQDSYIVLTCTLAVLAFPLGLLPLFAYGLLVVGDVIAPSTLGAALALLLMALFGFIQWFWLIPRLVRWGRFRLLAVRRP